jgi:hypothetical protein
VAHYFASQFWPLQVAQRVYENVLAVLRPQITERNIFLEKVELERERQQKVIDQRSLSHRMNESRCKN